MIVHADPSIVSDNTGDVIISHYVKNELRRMFPNDHIVSVPTQTMTISRRLNSLLSNARAIVVGGSNLLSGRYPRIRQWANMSMFAPHREKVHLIGCGWHSYEKRSLPFNGILLRSALGKNGLHSVRDAYTKSKLAANGIPSWNTGCPTMWGLSGEYPSKSEGSVGRIIFTLTHYRKDVARDKALLSYVRSLGKEMYFWPQSPQDTLYLRELVGNDKVVRVIGEKISSVEEIADGSAIYIGTRLHGAIHLLNRSVPVFVAAIDNRAMEIGRDTGLPLIDIRNLPVGLPTAAGTHISMPQEEIAAWKKAVQERIDG
ncbi:polysaccharide pyruvyl transferase family protein [Mesorhizobium sp.]|uniref:polysaccharide pyruvyl transferase family protein n=1 Tax=Mesorhizobium sp. TaxID=1871066 RepID=UPI000FE6535F|nr:polysaccharide pyruvyl transferase family protein [Mesorhizobium sp.]RWI10185.1 MAG: polysaccharide pyruvyl transferase family protein [Mesorhizobium sp.]RWM81891.1 MAG: polysaccharide pyruvyl transferase family protein [Mesorhizobium sp.]